PQRDVEDGAVLRDVDVLAAEHRVAPLGDALLVGELDKELQRLVGDPVLRVVEEEPGAFCDQALTAAGVLGEELAQMPFADRGVMLLQGLPGRLLPELRFRAHAAQPICRLLLLLFLALLGGGRRLLLLFLLALLLRGRRRGGPSSSSSSSTRWRGRR